MQGRVVPVKDSCRIVGNSSNKHLMTGPRETVSFVSPRPSMFASGNIEVEGKYTHSF